MVTAKRNLRARFFSLHPLPLNQLSERIHRSIGNGAGEIRFAVLNELPVLGVAVSADGTFLVSGAADGTARAWDPNGGKSLWTWSGKSKAVCGVSIRAGNKHVALATADGSLVVLDIADGNPKELASLSAHVAGVAAVAYSPDGTKLATVGGDGALRIWTLAETGLPMPLAKFEGQAKPGTASGFSPLSAVSFSADGRFVASAGADAVVRVWDVQTKAEVRGLRGHTEWATCVAFGKWQPKLLCVNFSRAGSLVWKTSLIASLNYARPSS